MSLLFHCLDWNDFGAVPGLSSPLTHWELRSTGDALSSYLAASSAVGAVQQDGCCLRRRVA